MAWTLSGTTVLWTVAGTSLRIWCTRTISFWLSARRVLTRSMECSSSPCEVLRLTYSGYSTSGPATNLVSSSVPSSSSIFLSFIPPGTAAQCAKAAKVARICKKAAYNWRKCHNLMFLPGISSCCVVKLYWFCLGLFGFLYWIFNRRAINCNYDLLLDRKLFIFNEIDGKSRYGCKRRLLVCKHFGEFRDLLGKQGEDLRTIASRTFLD